MTTFERWAYVEHRRVVASYWMDWAKGIYGDSLFWPYWATRFEEYTLEGKKLWKELKRGRGKAIHRVSKRRKY